MDAGQQSPSAPVQSPQQAGVFAQGRMYLLMGRKMIQTAVAMLPTDTDEGKAAVKALNSLASISGDVGPGLMDSQLQAMQGAVQGVPSAADQGQDPSGAMSGPAPSFPLGRSQSPNGF